MANLEDLEALHDEVLAAIKRKLEGGAVDSFTTGDEEIQTASLDSLVKLKRELEEDIERVKGGQASRFLRAKLA